LTNQGGIDTIKEYFTRIGFIKTAQHLTRVVFPEPLAPTTATVFPAGNGNIYFIQRIAFACFVTKRQIFNSNFFFSENGAGETFELCFARQIEERNEIVQEGIVFHYLGKRPEQIVQHRISALESKKEKHHCTMDISPLIFRYEMYANDENISRIEKICPTVFHIASDLRSDSFSENKFF
jgi:hypothetical protein